MFAFAGIWDRWRNPNGNNVETCSILTTTSNAVTSAVHDRMPVILDPDNYDLWPDPGMLNVAAASRLANDDEECPAPVERVQIENRLLLLLVLACFMPACYYSRHVAKVPSGLTSLQSIRIGFDHGFTRVASGRVPCRKDNGNRRCAFDLRIPISR